MWHLTTYFRIPSFTWSNEHTLVTWGWFPCSLFPLNMTFRLILLLFIFLILPCFLLILLFLFLLLFLILCLLLLPLIHLLMLLLLSPWSFHKIPLLYNYWISQRCSTFSSAPYTWVTNVLQTLQVRGTLLYFSPLMLSYNQEMFFVFPPWFTAIFIFKYFNFLLNNLIMGARIPQSM